MGPLPSDGLRFLLDESCDVVGYIVEGRSSGWEAWTLERIAVADGELEAAEALARHLGMSCPPL